MNFTRCSGLEATLIAHHYDSVLSSRPLLLATLAQNSNLTTRPVLDRSLTPTGLVYNLLVMYAHPHSPAAPARLDATFAALADPTRRAILARLAAGESSVMELAR